MSAQGVALNRIPSQSAFVVFSESAGVISEHETEGDTIKSFAEYLKKKKTNRKEIEPTILKRESDGWYVY